MSDIVERLAPCPFCGGAAEWHDITEADETANIGGSCIVCTRCQACGPVQFGEKDTIIEQWNRRSDATITALREEVERLKRKAYEAEGRLALLVDRATYADSYGVPGSDFTCCLFCRGGGAPNVPFEHEDTCPIKTLEGCAQSWFDADRERDGWLDEETAARKSAETELTALRQRVVEVVGPFARAHADLMRGGSAPVSVSAYAAARALVNDMETTDGK